MIKKFSFTSFMHLALIGLRIKFVETEISARCCKSIKMATSKGANTYNRQNWEESVSSIEFSAFIFPQ